MSGDAQVRAKRTYGRQWDHYRIIRPEEDRHTFAVRTGWDPAALAGLDVLDAGCGMGRYARVAAESARLVVGIELSPAARAALEVCADRPNVAIVRGDLLRQPFGEMTFDRIYSLGVLDHTPDPRAAFLAAAGRLRPGGQISIWVYRKEKPIVERIMNAHRAVSTRLPVPALERLSRWMAPVGGLKRRWMLGRSRPLRRLAVALHALTIGVSMHPDPEVRICDTLDWYAPKYASRHTVEEVREWFDAAGLVDVADPSAASDYFHAGQGHGVNLRGTRPGA